MRHQSQVFHEAACLSLGGIGGAQHPPLGGLKRTGSAHFPCLLELARYPSHVTQSGDVGEAREDLCDAGAVHLESLDRPVSRGDGVLETHRDLVLTDVTHNVKLSGTLLGNGLVSDPLQLKVELLEEVFEQEREQL